ncbi:hypothetical protein BDY19DRAFT_406229 [Irpex rosettiformis]|uniref:Uncharacterized protein n=1 Tax=Irpex rosettiformis TaxID=378272 RepID=A0ACB8UFL7_9APHY|nr:hypothetical protein BDY19DRAFT_406229 [Irpex rosettiformis]
MKRFHDWFKLEFDTVYELADGSYTQRGMSTKMYLASAQQLRRHLTMHHTIEEQHIFPVLAQRMPSFREDEAHIKSHHGIHEGLDKLGILLEKYVADPTTYSPAEIRTCLDSWREVLFNHLDEEVEDLSATNMKKYWKLEELDMIPM